MIFKKAEYTDKVWLTEVMTAAFNYDTAIHRTDTKEDGPPGYDDGTLAEKMLRTADLLIYTIIVDQKRIGFLSFSVVGTLGTLEKFCLLPIYINQGFGTKAWQLLEEQQSCKKWVLETPDYSLTNHYFYEKCGFIRTGKKKYDDDSYSIIFEKECK